LYWFRDNIGRGSRRRASAERIMSDDNNISVTPRGHFEPGLDDAVVVPLAVAAFAVKKFFQTMLSVLVHILDYAFPVVLQLLRFPLFTLRMIGDGVVALLRGVLDYLPVSATRRDAWRAAVTRYWSWLRQTISYKAFEEALHHAFEGGMAWVFRKCRTLTPGGALLVIFGAILWLPISFGVATAIHAILIAEATSLPAWMQLLHPLATLIAKSKLLVLPVYPAAWPQAKRHPFVQAIFRFYRYLAGLRVMRKLAYRYRQTEHAATRAADALGRAAVRVGLDEMSRVVLAGLGRLAVQIREAVRTALTVMSDGSSRLPFVGSIVRSYAVHYDRADRPDTKKTGEKIRGLFARWALNFSAEYYEAKERQQAAAHRTGA
jgi:hypothetical protein